MRVSYAPVLCAMQGNSSVCTLQSAEHCNREWSGGIALQCSGDVRLAGLPSGAAAPPYSSVGPGADFARLAWALHQSKAVSTRNTRRRSSSSHTLSSNSQGKVHCQSPGIRARSRAGRGRSGNPKRSQRPATGTSSSQSSGKSFWSQMKRLPQSWKSSCELSLAER